MRAILLYCIMENITEEKLFDELREKHPILFDIEDIFNNEFGEENVDFTDRVVYNAMKACESNSYSGNISDYVRYIVVRFPEVTVSNERDESVKIYDLFVKIGIRSSGLMSSNEFYILKSTYTKAQFNSGYIHSHVPRLCGFDDIANFKSPCLGTGPIRATCNSLMTDSSLWSLFAYELKLYVQTESLKGGPYIYIRNINGVDTYKSRQRFSTDIWSLINNFILWICENGEINRLGIGYKKGSFVLGEDFVRTALELTGMFAEYFTQKNLVSRIKLDNLCEMCVIKDMEIYKHTEVSDPAVYSKFARNKHVLTFKRNSVTAKLIEDNNESVAKPVPILHYSIVTYIIYYFTTILNTNEYEHITKNNDSTVRYII